MFPGMKSEKRKFKLAPNRDHPVNLRHRVQWGSGFAGTDTEFSNMEPSFSEAEWP